MRNIVLSHLLLPLFASLAFSATAAPATPAVDNAVPVVASAIPVNTLNLNTADAATLQKELKGIGKTKADAIVTYRNEHGPFASVDELLEINGIGKALLESNREKLTVD